jgi:hypothetical protein
VITIFRYSILNNPAGEYVKDAYPALFLTNLSTITDLPAVGGDKWIIQ